MEDGADGADGGIQPLRDLAIDALQPPRFHPRSIEFVGQSRPVGTERLNPACKLVFVTVGFMPSLHCAFERFQPPHQPLGRGIDVRGRRLDVARTVGGAIVHGDNADLPWPATWKVRGSASVYSEKFTWQARRVQRRLQAMHCKATFPAAAAFHRLGLIQSRCYPAVTSGAKNGCAAP